jgi:hypothetical protein
VNQRFRVAAAVYGVLVDGDRMLLMRRAGSGYRDEELSLPAGHLDGAEDALTGLLRELREEDHGRDRVPRRLPAAMITVITSIRTACTALHVTPASALRTVHSAIFQIR